MLSPETSSAIADLSYRTYDGPIGSVAMRWAVIARVMILKAFRMKSVWVMTVLSGWYFLVMITIIFFMQQIGAGSPNVQEALNNLINGIVWKDQLFHGFGFSQHIMLIVALIVGAGSIANDNRANALLVYLSKPTRKIDYLLGKWIGVFVPILTVITIPTVIFYLYGLFSFREQGFLSKDPWLIVQVLAVLTVAAAIHTSLILFVSSLFKQGTVAGSVYAGIYFMGYFFSLLMGWIYRVGGDSLSPFVRDLNYASIDGFIIGFGRAVIRPTNTRPFGIPLKIQHPLPNLAILPYFAVVLILIGACTYATWTRIRAVEVV